MNGFGDRPAISDHLNTAKNGEIGKLGNTTGSAGN